MGVALCAGRTKPGGAPVVVISYRLWKTPLRGEPSAIGRTIQINDHPYTIIGVAPPVFQAPDQPAQRTLDSTRDGAAIVSSRDRLHERSDTWVDVLGRMNPESPRVRRKPK